MSTVLVTGGSGFIGSHSHPAAPGRGPSGAHDGAEPEARGRRARHAEGRRRRAGRSLVLHRRRSRKRRGLAGSRRRLRVRAARGVAISPEHPQARGRADRARARRHAPRAARLARRRRQARGADLLVRGDRLWPEAAENAVQRDELDGPQWRRRAPLREIEDLGRTRGLGFHRQRRRRPRAFRRQSGGRVRPGPGARLFDLDPRWCSA